MNQCVADRAPTCAPRRKIQLLVWAVHKKLSVDSEQYVRVRLVWVECRLVYRSLTNQTRRARTLALLLSVCNIPESSLHGRIIEVSRKSLCGTLTYLVSEIASFSRFAERENKRTNSASRREQIVLRERRTISEIKITHYWRREKKRRKKPKTNFWPSYSKNWR